ncbi:major facilitator superfamily transporter [Purpureocillium lavendulum]|uniref:Major facilitator superfamily transporter n=1 Tax=Purpureocillium lavendulum TaxID=1247861 RepID=A0AB34G4X6_9HYPO|nr:major facilitator superfamily transporter [Purpureocillium lavendulum]
MRSHRTGGSFMLKQWDGARRTCKNWSSLGRDPELSARDGNCLIYLHSKGRTRRDPAFKIPFSSLLATKCFPLIQRFLVTDGYRPQTPEEILRWYRLSPRRTVELYIPPPPTGDKQQALQYHIATRNLLAWVARRSVVGQTLGGALVMLLHSMNEFRAAGEDNVGDLLGYLDEEGYLTLANQPNHAMAVLHLAEAFHLQDLYVRAFAHCVGMMESLPTCTEYQNLMVNGMLMKQKNMTPTTKRLIRQRRADLDARLKDTGVMLSSFLDHELSEAYIGIPLGARMHLDRFRSFLLSFYSARFGYYPPRQFDGTMLRAMADDFAALHALLEDDGYTAGPFDLIPSPAVGGICTLQLVQAFDARNQFDPLQHPLPLLPQVGSQGSARRIPWFPRIKDRADQRQVEYAALVRASHWREDLFRNDLVRAYRRFEEASVVTPSRADRHERVSLLDARKVRWILIYAVHQTLRHATGTPAGIPDDKEARYLLSAPIEGVIPWKGTKDIEMLARRQTDLTLGLEGNGFPSPDDPMGAMEIKPDVDYFALTHKTPPPSSRARRSSLPGPSASVSRSNSFTRALSRSSTLRRSVRRLKQVTSSSAGPTPPTTAGGQSKPAYHEIVVHGYGNGTNNVNFDAATPTRAPSIRRLDTSVGVASRSDSTASASRSDSSTSSMGLTMTADSPAETLASSITVPSPTMVPVADPDISWVEAIATAPAKPSRRWSQHDGSIRPSVSKSNSLKRRPMSAAIEGYNYAKSFGHFVEQEGRSMLSRSGGSGSGISRRHSLMGGGGPELRRKASMPLPRVIDEEEAAGVLPRDSCDWTAMQAFLDGKTGEEEYADLGGLIAVR